LRIRDLKRFARRAWIARSRYPVLRLPLPTRFEGGWFLAFGDEMGYTIFFKRIFEDHERRFVERIIKHERIHTFVDVGANQGLYTLIAARYMAHGQVVAFEPLTAEAKKLSSNVLMNRYTNVRVEETALGAFEGEAEMFMVLSGKAGYSSLRPPADDVSADSARVRVKVSTIDHYVLSGDLMSLDLVKIDVEGGELDVLRGAERAIDTYQPVFLIEVEDRRTRQWGYPASEILRFLSERGYRWFDIDAAGDLVPHSTTPEYPGRNLVAVPSSRQAGLSK
jgi:FkbM family methyltransferase